jgi:hypothetical protein
MPVAPRLILGLLLATAFHARAELEWETVSAELTVAAEDRGIHAFRFKNTGPDTIHIEDAKSSCSCVVVELGARTIAPGEGGELLALFKPAPGFPAGGERGAHIKVTTAETPAKPHVLRIKLRTDREASLEPAVLWWKRGSKAVAKETLVQVPLGAAVRLSEEALRQPDLECLLSEVQNGASAVLSVRPRSTRQPLDIRLALEFTAPGNAPKVRTLFIRVQ